VALANGDEIQMGKFRLVFLNTPRVGTTTLTTTPLIK
jgi:hypothetical protein